MSQNAEMIEKEIEIEVSRRLIELRERAGKKIPEVAVDLGVQRTIIWRYENLTMPKDNMKVKLAKYYSQLLKENITVEDIFYKGLYD